MVDVDRRPQPPHGLPRPPSHAAGLRRLSTRAAAPATPRSPAPHAEGPAPSAVLSHLAAAGVTVLPGLSAAELARSEAALGGLLLPPDLRELLALGVPSGDGFPDYSSTAGLRLLRFAAHEVPAAVAGTLRLPSRRRSGRPPPLVPLYCRYYVPARPCLAGNPVFQVSDSGITIAGTDVADFLLRTFAAEPPQGAPLRRQLSAPMPPAQTPPSTARRSLDSATGKAPRWIEFWTDAATAAAGDRFLEVRTDTKKTNNSAAPLLPEWLPSYLDWLGSALRHGGWGDSDVADMVGVGAVDPDGGDGEAAAEVDGVVVLKADWCCGVLRRAGWGVDEVVDALGVLLTPRRGRPAVALPPDVAERVGKLAEAVSRAVGSDDPKPAR